MQIVNSGICSLPSECITQYYGSVRGSCPGTHTSVFTSTNLDTLTRNYLIAIEDACGGSSPHPLATCRSCVSIGKIAAMISAVNSTCRAEAEPAAAEDDAEAEAEAGRVHGGNNWSQFSDRCSEALGTVPAKSVPGSSIMRGPLSRFSFLCRLLSTQKQK